MADDANQGDTPKDAENTDAAKATTDDSVVAQAEKPDAVKHALDAERASRKAAEKRANELAAKVQEFESANQSELEKLTGKLTKAEQAAAKAEGQLLRFEVAKEKEIPAEAIDLLNGSSREELEASADKILNLVKNRTENDNEPDFDGGAREPAPNTDPSQAHNDTILTLAGLKRNF
jgi:hypothetical protein